VNKAFTARTISRLRPRIEQITTGLLDDMSGTVDLLESFAFPLPMTVICEVLGIPDDDKEDFRSWSATLVSALPPRRSSGRPVRCRGIC
jgi:cytochrome P450